jgi:hypothetical protein
MGLFLMAYCAVLVEQSLCPQPKKRPDSSTRLEGHLDRAGALCQPEMNAFGATMSLQSRRSYIYLLKNQIREK